MSGTGMNKSVVLLVLGNVALAGGIIATFMSKKGGTPQTSDSVAYNVEVNTLESGEADSGPVILKDLDRKKRMTARHFLPAPGERNALTDLVDGMVIEGMRRGVPISGSFDKLLEEEGVVKAEKYKQKRAFKTVMREYLQKVYKIQRGLEEGDIIAEQDAMKGRLSAEVGLDGTRLNRLIEIEKTQKSNRQLQVFEKLLIRDDDKLNDEQRQQIKDVLVADQVTLFDPPMKENDLYSRSDKVLNDVSQVLNKDQAAHFQYFQEYHWHSYDMQEMNDMPMF